MSCVLWGFFTLAHEKAIPGPVWVLRVFHLLLFWWFFPQPWIVFSHSCSTQFSGEGLVWGPLFSLCVALSSPISCPMNSTHHSLLELPTLSTQLRETSVLFLGSPSQSCSLKLSMQWAWALIGFTSFLDLFQGSLSFAASCPMSENCYFLYISPQFFSCLSN